MSTLIVNRSNADGWEAGSLKGMLDQWEAATARGVHFSEPMWVGLRDTRPDLAVGRRVVLYQSYGNDSRGAKCGGFMGLARITGTLDYSDYGRDSLDIEVLMRFSLAVPLKAVSRDPELRSNRFCTFRMGTNYTFRGSQAERLVAALAAHLPRAEARLLLRETGFEHMPAISAEEEHLAPSPAPVGGRDIRPYRNSG